MAAAAPLITIITSLLPLVVDLEPLVAQLIAQISAQTGQTADEIFTLASASLSQTEQDLLKDIMDQGGTV